MKFVRSKLFLCLVTTVLSCLTAECVAAQDVNVATGRSGQSEASLAPGTAIPVELNYSADSKNAKPGDAIVAHTTEVLKSTDGRIILARGTKVEGHITQASARGKGGDESALGIQFDKAALKDGGEMPLNVIIQALAAPASYSGPLDGNAQPNPSLPGTTQTSPMSGHAGPPRSQAPPPATLPDPAAASAGTTQLDAKSRGVIGLRGLTLSAEPANNRAASVVVSNGKSVHLDGGTRMLLVMQGPASEPSGQ